MDPGYLCLGGTELVNNCRTQAYIANMGMPYLMGPPQQPGCCCPATTIGVVPRNLHVRVNVSALVFNGQYSETLMFPRVDVGDISHYDATSNGGTAIEILVNTTTVMASFDGGITWVSAAGPGAVHDFTVLYVGTYSTPADDDAPWYDATIPESADFLGIWIEEVLTPTPYTRPMRPTQHGGSLAGPIWGPREIHVTGWLYARSVKAAEYGKQWLFEALIDDCGGACALPDLAMYRTCCGDTPDSELRTFKGVGLIAAPNWQLEPQFPPNAGCKFEITLQAEQPFAYAAPAEVASGLVYDLMADPFCNICSPCPTIDSSVCLCGALKAPERIVTRDGSDDSWCKPVLVRRRFVPLPPTPQWSSAAGLIRIRVGTVLNALGQEGLKNLRLLAFPNPLGLLGPIWVDPDDDTHTEDYTSYWVCGDPCMSIEVSCLPPDSELVIDATTRTATVSCGNLVGSGYPYLSSNNGAAFRWPELDCTGMMVVIEADDQHTPPDTTFEVLSVPRDRA